MTLDVGTRFVLKHFHMKIRHYGICAQGLPAQGFFMNSLSKCEQHDAPLQRKCAVQMGWDVRDLEAGWSVRRIAHHLDVSKSTVDRRTATFRNMVRLSEKRIWESSENIESV